VVVVVAGLVDLAVVVISEETAVLAVQTQVAVAEALAW
jgi:hypothetical protein